MKRKRNLLAPQRRLGGFTLIELLVAMAILAIILAIAIPSYMDYVLRSRVRTAQADLAALSSAVENVRQRTLAYPATAGVAQFTQWHPASKSEFFSFDYAREDSAAGYSASATWEGGGKLDGCVLSINQRNERSSNTACSAVGNVSW